MNVKLSILFGVLWLAFGCFYLSEDFAKSAREIEEVCRNNKKIEMISFSGSLRVCSSDNLNAEVENFDFKSSVFHVAGTGLLLTLGFLPILFAVRENQNSKNAVESIMNSDAAKPDYKL